MASRVKKEYEKHIDSGAFILMLGGEYSISTGALQALASRYNSREITVCQIDTHTWICGVTIPIIATLRMACTPTTGIPVQGGLE